MVVAFSSVANLEKKLAPKDRTTIGRFRSVRSQGWI